MLRDLAEARLQLNQDLRGGLVPAKRLGDRIRVLHDVLGMRRRRVALGNRLVVLRKLRLLQLVYLEPEHVELVFTVEGCET